MWVDANISPLPFVPLYWNRVTDLAAMIEPGFGKHRVTVLADFPDSGHLPRGGLRHLSPCETIHAVLHACARQIRSGECPQSELTNWLRTLLSYPGVFIKCDDDDAVYAEANSLRQDISGESEAVTFSARQLVYNIVGFKTKKESRLKTILTADKLAQFWDESVRVSQKHKFMTKKSTIDTCLTIYNRLLSIDGVEEIIADGESRDGEDSVWIHSL